LTNPSRRAPVQKDSISTVRISPVAECRKLDHANCSGLSTKPRFTGLGRPVFAGQMQATD
jgi:hypothetical protein